MIYNEHIAKKYELCKSEFESEDIYMEFQSTAFIVTPDELENALLPFKIFINNAHVSVNYTYTPNSVFINNYRELYKKLCLGERIDYKLNDKILQYFAITTNISTIKYDDKHFYNGEEYMLYKGSSRGYAPYFAPFTFNAYSENNKVYVSTKASWMVEYTDIMGFQLLFPKLTKNEAQKCNISSEKEWDSYSDYKLFKKHITNNTTAFCFKMNGIEKKTSIRVSKRAKEVLSEFYCIKKNNIFVV